AYGIWTECDQISAASEVFEILDKQEDIKHNADAFLIMFCGLWRVLVGWTPFGKLPPQLNLVLRSLTIGQSFADLGDYLYRMPEINFDVDIKRKAYLIALDTELADKLMVIARSRHTSPEVLINAWRKFWSL
ncbi:MAG: hypothetical protein ACE5PV_20180, partial [Candidatus Poribacteria bacterium]